MFGEEAQNEEANINDTLYREFRKTCCNFIFTTITYGIFNFILVV